MADLEKLVVALEARTKSFEAALKKSQTETNRAMSAIEKRTKEASRDISASLGGVGTLLRGIFTAATLSAIRTAIGNVADLADAADRVGVSSKALQEFRYAVQLSGGAVEQADQGLTKFVKNLSDAARGTGDLGKVFRANGVALTDAQGNLISTGDALSRYAELVRNAKNPQDQLNLAVIGFGKDAGASMVNALRDGAAGFEAASRRAEELGLVLDDSVIAKARELDDRFTELEIGASTWLKTMAITVADVALPALMQVYAAIKDIIAVLPNVSSSNDDLGRRLATLREGRALVDRKFGAGTGAANLASNYDGSIADIEAQLRQRGLDALKAGKGSPLSGAGSSSALSVTIPRSTVLPSGGSSSLDAFERETQAIRKRTAELGLETSSLGKSTFEIEKAKVALDLENAARQAGIPLTAAQKAQIDQLSTSYAAAAVNLETAQKQQAAMNDLQQEFKSITMDIFGSLISGGKDFSQVLSDIAKKLAEAALQAAIFGEGPLRGLFGGGGGLLGGLFGGGGGLAGSVANGGLGFAGLFANGGTIPSGQVGIVGEGGKPELVRGPASVTPLVAGMGIRGRSAPDQAPALVVNNSIDARGATPDAVALLERRIPSIVQQTFNQARKRGMV
jgi:hypothetical protein